MFKIDNKFIDLNNLTRYNDKIKEKLADLEGSDLIAGDDIKIEDGVISYTDDVYRISIDNYIYQLKKTIENLSITNPDKVESVKQELEDFEALSLEQQKDVILDVLGLSDTPYEDLIIKGTSSHAEGFLSQAKGNYSHAEGFGSIANREVSHAEGGNSKANGFGSHAEGFRTEANGYASHAEGFMTEANGDYSHSEGEHTFANGYASHTEGFDTEANGVNTHAEGYATDANGPYSHSEGFYSNAYGNSSHAEGVHSTAVGEAQHVSGHYNEIDFDKIFIVGVGSSETRKNGFSVDYNGNVFDVNGPLRFAYDSLPLPDQMEKGRIEDKFPEFVLYTGETNENFTNNTWYKKTIKKINTYYGWYRRDEGNYLSSFYSLDKNIPEGEQLLYNDSLDQTSFSIIPMESSDNTNKTILAQSSDSSSLIRYNMSQYKNSDGDEIYYIKSIEWNENLPCAIFIYENEKFIEQSVTGSIYKDPTGEDESFLEYEGKKYYSTNTTIMQRQKPYFIYTYEESLNIIEREYSWEAVSSSGGGSSHRVENETLYIENGNGKTSSSLVFNTPYDAEENKVATMADIENSTTTLKTGIDDVNQGVMANGKALEEIAEAIANLKTSGGTSQQKTVTPSATEQIITPDEGTDFLSQVTVGAIPYREEENEAGGTTIIIG